MRTESASAISANERTRVDPADALLEDPGLGLYAIAQASTSAPPGGRAAARRALEVVRREYYGAVTGRRRPLSTAERLAAVRRAVEEAAAAVHRLSRPGAQHAGVVVSLTVVVLEGSQGLVAHVGATRLYVYRRGNLEALTSDHTLAGELLRTGNIGPDEARRHPLAAVLSRSLGPQPSVLVEHFAFPIRPGDRLLMTSECRRWMPYQLPEIRGFITARNVEQGASGVVEALRRLGERDMMAAILIDVHEAKPSPRLLTVDALCDVPLFSGLGLAACSRLVGFGSLLHVQSSEPVIERGGVVQGLHLVVAGRLQSRGPAALDLLSGDWFGEHALARPYVSPRTIIATSPTDVWLLRGDELRRLARQRPSLGCPILIRLCSLLSEGAPDRLQVPGFEGAILGPDDTTPPHPTRLS
jgi:protein phosphatase